MHNVLMIFAKLTQLELTFVKNVNEDMLLMTKMSVHKYHAIVNKDIFSTPMTNATMLENIPDLIAPQGSPHSPVVRKSLLKVV